jgi:hypothetical protein
VKLNWFTSFHIRPHSRCFRLRSARTTPHAGSNPEVRHPLPRIGCRESRHLSEMKPTDPRVAPSTGSDPEGEPTSNHAADADRKREHVKAPKACRLAGWPSRGNPCRRGRLDRAVRVSIPGCCSVAIMAEDSAEAVEPVVMATKQ